MRWNDDVEVNRGNTVLPGMEVSRSCSLTVSGLFPTFPCSSFGLAPPPPPPALPSLHNAFPCIVYVSWTGSCRRFDVPNPITVICRHKKVWWARRGWNYAFPSDTFLQTGYASEANWWMCWQQLWSWELKSYKAPAGVPGVRKPAVNGPASSNCSPVNTVQFWPSFIRLELYYPSIHPSWTRNLVLLQLSTKSPSAGP